MRFHLSGQAFENIAKKSAMFRRFHQFFSAL